MSEGLSRLHPDGRDPVVHGTEGLQRRSVVDALGARNASGTVETERSAMRRLPSLDHASPTAAWTIAGVALLGTAGTFVARVDVDERRNQSVADIARRKGLA